MAPLRAGAGPPNAGRHLRLRPVERKKKGGSNPLHGDEDMTNMHTTKAQEKMEFKAQSTFKSNLLASPVETAGAGLTKMDAQAGINLRGEVNRLCTVDNQRRRGAVIAGFNLCNRIAHALTGQIQEGEHGWIMPRTETITSSSISDFESRTTQNQAEENDLDMTNMHTTKAQEKMEFKAQSTFKSKPHKNAGISLRGEIRDQEPSAWSYFNQRWSKRPTKPETRPEGPISRVWKEE
ncbi:hypothetical protein U9M48_003590 [Paspalum notatum var. saurae]|uniref:Uncharacterized protein n=1 Tax=Paspalum notatum var. saurae TaxID=547442 RepID=A0AAQ3PJ75_PASNO